MIEIGLIVARFLHYLATTALAGLSLFPLYAYAGAEPGVLGRWRQRWILWIAVAALFSGLCWFAFAAANMSGSMADLLDAETLWAVVHDTGSGKTYEVVVKDDPGGPRHASAFVLDRKDRLWLGADRGEWGGWCFSVDLDAGRLVQIPGRKVHENG